MFFKIFKTKKFWIIWFILSLSGGIITKILSVRYYDKLDHTTKCHVELFGTHKTIWVLRSTNDVDVYMDYMENREKYEYLPFPLVGIGDVDVFIMDTLMDGKILEIECCDENVHGSDRDIWRRGYYIYYKYLDDCQPAKPGEYENNACW